MQPDTAATPPAPRARNEARTREHLANQRTLLAWIRTAISLMGLGFVVARFALFLREVAGVQSVSLAPTPGWSAWIGVALVAAGVIAGALGAMQFFRTRDQIERADFQPSAFAELSVLFIVLIAGFALALYLAVTT
jgi:putative membrane protein